MPKLPRCDRNGVCEIPQRDPLPDCPACGRSIAAHVTADASQRFPARVRLGRRPHPPVGVPASAVEHWEKTIRAQRHLHALLLSEIWRKSTVRVDGQHVVIAHPSGSEARIALRAFEPWKPG